MFHQSSIDCHKTLKYYPYSPTAILNWPRSISISVAISDSIVVYVNLFYSAYIWLLAHIYLASLAISMIDFCLSTSTNLMIERTGLSVSLYWGDFLPLHPSDFITYLEIFHYFGQIFCRFLCSRHFVCERK